MQLILGEQAQVLFAASEAADVDVVLVQKLKVEIAQWRRLLQNLVCLMPIAAAGDEGRQVVVGVVGGIAEIAADDDRCVIEEGPALFGDQVQTFL